MSIIKHVTLQKIVAHDFRYDPRKFPYLYFKPRDLILVNLNREKLHVKHTLATWTLANCVSVLLKIE